MLETNNDIEFESIQEVDLIDVVNQLEKDIQSSGERYEFTSETPENLISELSDYLKKVDKGTRLSNLLYRIDVNTAYMDPKQPYYVSLSRVIWNRIFQKVWFRKNY
ncbi:MAG: hypothetical protein HKP14_03635 [Bacteroidia bacterium]|nr:hypothetical protein [Bacteroidia bacterium]